jgi:hypothetical protein
MHAVDCAGLRERNLLQKLPGKLYLRAVRIFVSKTKNEMEKIYYKEEQCFRQWWIWLLLIGAFAVAVVPLWVGLYRQVSAGISFGDRPAGNGELAAIAIFVTLLMGAIVWLFSAIKLQVEIRDSSLRFRYIPLVRKWREIGKGKILHYEVGKYKPVVDYGGWGIRISFLKKRKAFNISGNLGLRLNLSDGRTILLGTRRPQAVAAAMEKMMDGNAHPVKPKFRIRT